MILVINNAMAKIASQIKSSPPGAGFYLVSWENMEDGDTEKYHLSDVALILRQLKSKKSQSPHTFHYERKKVFEPMFVLESKRKDKFKS